MMRSIRSAAISSVQYNEELKDYYQRKVSEGKNKMSVINAVRNKLLHQIVAVIRRGTPYVPELDKNQKKTLARVIDFEPRPPGAVPSW